MTARIISGFPGIGKSVLASQNEGFLDSDSMSFSWQKDAQGNLMKDHLGHAIRNPHFPGNYIEHIKDVIPKSSVIFVSSHKDVRDALVAHGIPFTLVYPHQDLVDEYVERYQKRGSPESFIDFIKSNWTNFMSELDAQEGCEKVILSAGMFLKDVIDEITLRPRESYPLIQSNSFDLR